MPFMVTTWWSRRCARELAAVPRRPPIGQHLCSSTRTSAWTRPSICPRALARWTILICSASCRQRARRKRSLILMTTMTSWRRCSMSLTSRSTSRSPRRRPTRRRPRRHPLRPARPRPRRLRPRRRRSRHPQWPVRANSSRGALRRRRRRRGCHRSAGRGRRPSTPWVVRAARPSPPLYVRSHSPPRRQWL